MKRSLEESAVEGNGDIHESSVKKMKSTTTTTTTSLSMIPAECLQTVFLYFDSCEKGTVQTLHSCMLADKEFCRMAQSDIVWKSMCEYILLNRERYPWLSRVHGAIEKRDITLYDHVFKKKGSWMNVFKDMFTCIPKLEKQWEGIVKEDLLLNEPERFPLSTKFVNMACQLRLHFERDEGSDDDEKEEVTLEIGDSKIGGNPDLPDEINWPKTESGDEYLPFIAQINLSYVNDRFHCVQGVLPPDGWLFLFGDWSNDNDEGNTTCSFYWRGKVEELKPRSPTGLPVQSEVYSEKATPMFFSEKICMSAEWESEILAGKDLIEQIKNSEEAEQFDSMSSYASTDMDCSRFSSSFMGYPSGVQDLPYDPEDEFFLFQFSGNDELDLADSVMYFSVRKSELPINGGSMKNIKVLFQC